MSFQLVLTILLSQISVSILAFASIIGMKLVQAKREKQRDADLKSIRLILHELFGAKTGYFIKYYPEGMSQLAAKLRGKTSRQTLEDMLLMVLSNGNDENRVRARMIADHFGYIRACHSMMKDRITGNIAIGCRKAGLYKLDDAIPDILNTLDILSGDTQLQALMALARIGDAATLVQAFDKIHRLIFINERAVTEMLSIFSGDRYELFRKMIHHESDYLVRLFLKAIDRETANLLMDDIVKICKSGDKETRLAGIIAVGKSGSRTEIPLLIRAMRDREWEIRAMAAKILGVLTSPEAVKPLTEAARDSEWWVRQNAVDSILAYPDREAILLSIIQSGDKYAYDSIQYSLEKATESDILSELRGVSLKKPVVYISEEHLGFSPHNVSEECLSLAS